MSKSCLKGLPLIILLFFVGQTVGIVYANFGKCKLLSTHFPRAYLNTSCGMEHMYAFSVSEVIEQVHMCRSWCLTVDSFTTLSHLLCFVQEIT